MSCGPKFLQRRHLATASLLSLSMPGQNHLLCSRSHVWSQPKWPFHLCTSVTRLSPSSFDTHSTRATQSFAFVWMCHNLPSWIAKLSTQCLALRRALMSGMSAFVSASTTSQSHGSSVNCSHNLVCSSSVDMVVICITSFVMLELASQSGHTDHSNPSLSCLASLALAHLWLMASATTFVTPGWCRMSVMFQQVMDSSHLACVTLCHFLSSTSR